MKNVIRSILLGVAFLLPACSSVRSDRRGPAITEISISNEVVVISDCPSTDVTITAKVTDESKIESVVLSYRVSSQEPFSSRRMDLKNRIYTSTIQGSDLQGHGYGTVEFYVTAVDEAGNSSESQHNDRIQFLPCVNN